MANNESEPLPVELLTMQELAMEVFRRNSAVLLVTICNDKNNPGADVTTTWHKGGIAVAIGMADLAIQKLRRNHMNLDSGEQETE